MTITEIQHIADYVKDLEEGLVEWDYDQTAMQTEWTHLYEVIKTLMDEISKRKTKV